PEQRHYRARYRDEDSGQDGQSGAVLRRRVSLGAGRGQSAEDGISERHLAGWRMARAEGLGAAAREVGSCRASKDWGLPLEKWAPGARRRTGGCRSRSRLLAHAAGRSPCHKMGSMVRITLVFLLAASGLAQPPGGPPAFPTPSV